MPDDKGNEVDGHLSVNKHDKKCPKCGSGPEHREMRNHSLMWHEGDIHCTKCGAFVRSYDAG